MRALISQRVTTGPHGDRRDALEQAYVTFFERLGIQLIPVPNTSAHIDAYFELAIGGVILSGGNDVDGARYGGFTSADASTDRDRTEDSLVTGAVARHLPILGICRGMQFLNVHFGGALVDLTAHRAWPSHTPGREHDVVAADDAGARLGTSRFPVNTFHRQAVTSAVLSRELRPFLVDPDSDVVEGLFHPARRIAGVQFHPERFAAPRDVDVALVAAFRDGQWFWEARA